jgi:hypothetical protein
MSKLRVSFISLMFALAIAMMLAACNAPQTLLRHVAEFRFGPEQATDQTATGIGTGGIAVFNKTFTLPSDQRTIFITLSSTGDGHGGAANLFSASVNNQVCNKGDEGASNVLGGWIPLQKHGGNDDLHDNGIYYTWCCTAGVRPGGANAIEIRLASSIAGQWVFIERSHFYVDSVSTNLCTAVDRNPSEDAAIESVRSKMPATHQHPPQQPEPPKP